MYIRLVFIGFSLQFRAAEVAVKKAAALLSPRRVTEAVARVKRTMVSVNPMVKVKERTGSVVEMEEVQRVKAKGNGARGMQEAATLLKRVTEAVAAVRRAMVSVNPMVKVKERVGSVVEMEEVQRVKAKGNGARGMQEAAALLMRVTETVARVRKAMVSVNPMVKVKERVGSVVETENVQRVKAKGNGARGVMGDMRLRELLIRTCRIKLPERTETLVFID